MGTKEEAKYRSSTWWDIKVYCLEVGKAHNGYVVFMMSPNVTERVSKAFAITVGWFPRGRGPSEGYLMGISEYWPHTDFRTVTDLYMWMLYRLDAKLTDWEKEKLTQSRF